ncbi:unnamed protein product (macronuclear) [Paramecium tetraurelia]|uniref:Uncharacterized protein n=1 Tax=Paramecium tetraurelia TaxID=5888 RepID=A0E342_PARTE|nr:uncharacterized protein GSPATT00022882001 [Paramecium tetraurelia]CAK89709.1 unnamed protein product [Paramecium tetraurelia]|eukprot:XP_001457106.1 hypothetical protein (macronuclear) [Paramecium tetraurelia strain d4-2]
MDKLRIDYIKGKGTAFNYSQILFHLICRSLEIKNMIISNQPLTFGHLFEIISNARIEKQRFEFSKKLNVPQYLN